MPDGVHIDVREVEQLAGELSLVVDPRALREGGLLAVELILERTGRGEDRRGKAFRPYSTRPLAVPSGSTTKAARTRLEGAGALQYFTSKKSGALWMLVTGGYAALKAARYPQDAGDVNLAASGAMLRSLGVVAQDGGSVTIGFSRSEEAQKALWNIEGAGGGLSRDFLGLTDPEAGQVADVVGPGVRVLAGNQPL